MTDPRTAPVNRGSGENATVYDLAAVRASRADTGGGEPDRPAPLRAVAVPDAPEPTDESARTASRRAEKKKPRKRERSRAGRALLLAHLLAAAALVWGWSIRDEGYLLPERGLGYWLGIAGLGAMVLLLGYSARKRLRLLRHAGRISTWFEIHMILGLAGPVAILFHCGFRLGSFNGTIALLSTLLVAASGIVGRLVHGRIHHRLSGRRTKLEEVKALLEIRRRELGLEPASEALVECLERFEKEALAPQPGLGAQTLAFLTIGHRCRRSWREARRLLGRRARREGASRAALRNARRAVRLYLGAGRRVAVFRFYERLFALWHVVHLPLCYLLFATATVHVLAVHMY